MLGTIVNFFAIIAGSILGLLIKKRLKSSYTTITITGLGLAVLFVGIGTALKGMFDPQAHSTLFIFSLVIGGLLGEMVDLDGKMHTFGDFLQRKLSSGESAFSQGFVTASLLYCVGAMAIIGAINDGAFGKPEILFAKSTLDGITSIMLAATYGLGVLFSAFMVLFYQGVITILASIIVTYLTPDMFREISIVGGALIFAIGLNMLELKKIKTANFLPALFVPIAYYLLLPLWP